jgi:ABC-type transport system involved in cytochrome c biogenesis permease subunit
MSTAEAAVFSDRAVMFAGIVFALALLAHVLEWAWSLARPVAVEARTPAPVGAPTHPVGLGGAADDPGRREAESSERAERAALRIETAARTGVALTVVGAVLLGAGLLSRSFATHPWRVPWGNMYEFSLTGCFGVAVMYLVLLRRYRLRWLGLFVTGFIVVVLMLANLTLDEAAGPLVPALHSYWLVVHVGAAILASGAFAVGALVSLVFLIRGRVSGGRMQVVLDRMAYRVHAVGFPLWTFAALIAGPIWAEHAWGSYWNWDPKEVWAFITWVIYAAYLHARATAGWKGKAAAILALVGFATLLFNFVGINFFFGAGSMHSYAGH